MTAGYTATFAKAVSFWLLFQGLLLVWAPTQFGLPRWLVAITFGSALSLIMLGVTRLYLASDNLSMSKLGLVPSWRSVPRFVLALLAGVAFFGFFFLVYLATTPVEVAPVSDPDLLNATVVAFLAMLTLGVMEEIAFRGYFLRKLDQAVGIRTAIYLTSIAFGLYHGWTVDSITGPAIWGLLYAVLAYWSKGLAVPIGFHVGANLIQALFSQKQKWVTGIWSFELTERATLLTIPQATMGLRALLLVIGVVLVEYYIRNVHRSGSAATSDAAPEATD